MAEEANYMDLPLITWITTFRDPGSPKLTINDLYDGAFVCKVMQEIDPRPAYQAVVSIVRDVNIRHQNWDILLKNIRAYYSEVLQQLIVMKLPNLHTISRGPEKDPTFIELQKVLLLVLGCAVQCEEKEHYIQAILKLDIDVQHELAKSIQQITDDTVSILPNECQDSDKLFTHLVRLIKEREEEAETMSDLVQERDYYRAQSEGQTVNVSPAGTPEKYDMLLELTELKTKVRKLKQELDDKEEQLSDLRDDYEEQKSQAAKLRSENYTLNNIASNVRSIQDENDILREQLRKANNHEAEILKYKEKLNTMEYYKARCEELRDDNAILTENKDLLEEQLKSSHQRIETVLQLEKEIIKYRQQVADMAAERDQDREKIQVLAEENAQLQFQKKTSMNENATLEDEIAATKAKIAGVGGAISDQLKETTNAKILRLELEKQHLLRKIDEIRESSLIENSALGLQLEKENQRLLAKVEKLEKENTEKSQKVLEIEDRNRRLLHDKDEVSHSTEQIKDNAERQIRELEQKNEDLSKTVEVLRTRNEQTSDTKIKGLERENKRLHETLSVKNELLTKVEFENRQHQKTQHRNKENVNKIAELENDKDHLEKENSELRHTVHAQELTCEKVDKLEKENSDLDIENHRLQRKITNLQTAFEEKEKLEQENINFKVENQNLQRTLENSKHSNARIADLENENSICKKELQQLKKVIEAKKAQSVKLEKMELDLSDLDNENMKLQRQLELTSNRLQQLEKDNADLEEESEKFHESSKHAQKRVNDLEKQNMEMEEEITNLQKENSRLTKENKRNKVTLETRESTIDDLTTKYSMLEMSHKELKRSIDSDKGANVYTAQLEKEHRELMQSLQVERETVTKLKTEVMNEKRKSQELNNQLEKTAQNLDKLGMKKSATLSPNSDSHIKAMESMMETLKGTLSIKEDKIEALESRLEESKNRNVKLSEDLRVARREIESLKQRYEEESLGKETERAVPVRASPLYSPGSQANTTHLVKLERENAALLNENDNLKSRNNNLNEQIKRLEGQLHSHTSSIQSQTGNLQSENANLHAERATLHAKCESLQSQNTFLQKQLSDMEQNRNELQRLHANLQTSHDQLIQFHENFQKIHEQTTAEYEALISEHGSLKSNHKNLKKENQDLRDQLNNSIHFKGSHGNLQSSNNKLRDDLDRLNAEHERVLNAKNVLQREKDDVLMENKRMKQEYNALQKDNADYREKLRLTETDLKYLADKYDALNENHQKVMDDNEQLMNQVKVLIQNFQELLNQHLALNENHQKVMDDNEQLMNQVKVLIQNFQELLNQHLVSKDKMAGQEKSYMEQLSDLRSQKERLEEKIMEHYKQRDKQKKSRGLGALLLQKVRGLKRSKSRPNLADGSADNSSLGSESFTDDADKTRKSDKRRFRRRRGSIQQSASMRSSTESLQGGLRKDMRGLAKSTTALNNSPSSGSRKIALSDLRGTRSTEDLSDPALCSNGDTVSLSNSSFTLLPGMGRPASDDEGGFRSRAGATSPEFLTLQEFLAEGVDKPSTSRTLLKNETKPEDTESRSSENSDSSARRRRPAPLPPTNQYRGRVDLIPNAVSASNDSSLSRISRVSTGSSGSSQDIRQENNFTHVTSPSYDMQPNNTSTPAKIQSGYTTDAVDALNLSAFSRVFPAEDHRNNSSYEPATPTRHHDNNYSDRYQYPPLNKDNTFEQENRLSADTRLDILTRGPTNTLSPPSPKGALSPNSNYSSPRDQRSQDEDMSVRSGPTMSPMQNWNRSQTPMSNQRPIRAYPQPQTAVPQQSSQGSPKKSNILVSRANITPRPFNSQKNVSRVRPASAFGAPNNLHGDNSPNTSLNNSRPNRSDLNNSLPHQNQSFDHSYNSGNVPTSQHSGGPTSKQSVTRRTLPTGFGERPKSVPPTMFNQQGSSDSDTNYNSNTEDYNSNHSNHTGTHGTPPVPPPRKNRDILTSGRYSVLREPTSPTKPFPGTSNYNMLNNIRSPSVQESKQVPVSSHRNSIKPSSKPPAPKPMKPEDGEPKKNSIWRQKRVTFDIDDLPESIIP